MPGFAQAVFSFASALKPLADLARKTLAHSDVRVSQRYFEILIDSRIPKEDQDRKLFFSYAGMTERVSKALNADEELERVAHEFQLFIKRVDELAAANIETELSEVDRFTEICRHDFERLLGLFDPGINLRDSAYIPDFGPVESERALPEVVDLYFLIAGFEFSAVIQANVLRLLERLYPQAQAREVQKRKVEKIMGALNKVLRYQLSQDHLLDMARVLRQEPGYSPPLPRERSNRVERYKAKMISQFDIDRERVRRERHESAIGSDIEKLFADVEMMALEGYDEETNAYLTRETPASLTYVLPLRLLKTFIGQIFETKLKEPVKRILVEGYFDNKNYQNNLANIVYQCERSGTRISEFEESLKGSGRVSIVALKRYVEEIRRGKDISSFLNKLVDTINMRAREIVEDETGLFAMLAEALNELLTDYKKSAPDIVTNIRTFAGGRNKEIMANIAKGQADVILLVRVMRNFTFIHPGTEKAKTPAPMPEPGKAGPAALQPPTA